MTNTTSQDSNQDEAELHRWFVQWVLGKNRGVEVPLESDKLLKLLENNFVNKNQLSEAELAHLSSANDHTSNAFQQGQDNKVEVSFSDVVLQGMEMMIKKMVDEDLSKIENSQRLSQEMLNKLYYDRFSFEYGIDSESLGQMIEDNLRKANHARNS